MSLTLTLLMAWVGANYVYTTFTSYNLAVFANSFDTGADFHPDFLTAWSFG